MELFWMELFYSCYKNLLKSYTMFYNKKRNILKY